MTLITETDHDAMRGAILAWARAGTGVPAIGWGHQDMARPAVPMGIIHTLSRDASVGVAEERQAFNETSGQLERRYYSRRQLIIQLDIYTAPATAPGETEAMELIENAASRLSENTSRDAFNAAGISYLSHESIQSLDDQLGDRWVRRAVLDVRFGFRGVLFDDGLGPSGDTIETIILPSEADGTIIHE